MSLVSESYIVRTFSLPHATPIRFDSGAVSEPAAEERSGRKEGKAGPPSPPGLHYDSHVPVWVAARTREGSLEIQSAMSPYVPSIEFTQRPLRGVEYVYPHQAYCALQVVKYSFIQ